MTSDVDKTLHLKVDDVVWRKIGEELVVLELSTSTYLTLNIAAAHLWVVLADGATVGELVDSLCNKYGISPEKSRNDVDAFLCALRERELVILDA